MSLRFTIALCTTAAIVGLTGARTTMAQSDQQTASPGGGLEEIVVTARKREERVQTVPLAITAFSQADLQKDHVQQLRDLSQAVPSFSIPPPANAELPEMVLPLTVNLPELSIAPPSRRA